MKEGHAINIFLYHCVNTQLKLHWSLNRYLTLQMTWLTNRMDSARSAKRRVVKITK